VRTIGEEEEEEGREREGAKGERNDDSGSRLPSITTQEKSTVMDIFSPWMSFDIRLGTSFLCFRLLFVGF
jgi:hypothetical protein